MSERTTQRRVDEMSCDEIAAYAVAERYLHSQLGESDQVAYELHFFDCDRCFRELTTVEALRTELSADAARVVETIGASRASQRNWWPVWLATAAVIVIGVGLWTLRPARETGPSLATRTIEPGPAPQEPAAATPSATPVAPQATLAALAQFKPPPYVAPVLRGPEDEARRFFQAAIGHYQQGDHAQAIDGLRLATSRNPRASDAGFFLGVSLLLTKQPRAGITELRRTIALGNSPYLEEAHFYLAKGLLQVGDVSAARRELRAMIALAGDHQREAKQLMSQIERVQPGR